MSLYRYLYTPMVLENTQFVKEKDIFLSEFRQKDVFFLDSCVYGNPRVSHKLADTVDANINSVC